VTDEPDRPTRPGNAQRVVTLPAEIDIMNASRVGGQLGAAVASGVAVVIADMTATSFIDSSGVRALVQAHLRAQAKNCELRLVVPAAVVLRILSLAGLDRLLPIHPTLDAAMAT